MFEPLGTPAFLADARRGRLQRSPVSEVFIFFLLTMIAQLLQGALTTPYTMIYILLDGKYKEFAAAGDMEGALAYSKVLEEKIMAEPLYIILMLFSTAATIACVLFYCRKLEGRSYFSLGLTKRPYKEYAVGFGIGILMLAVALGFSAVFGSVWYEGFSENFRVGTFIFLLLGYAVQGFSEELLCRGYLMVSMSRSMPLWMGVIVSAFAFAALHVGNAGFSFFGFLNVFLFGVLMALYMIRRGSIWGAAAIHTAWNFAEGVLVDSYVSGMKMPTSLFSFGQRAGDELIHGGAFGPEGGLAVTFVLALGIVLLLMAKTKNPQDPTLKLHETEEM